MKTKHSKITIQNTQTNKFTYISKILSAIGQFLKYLKSSGEPNYKPAYRVVEILKNEEQEHTVLIQIINSSRTFYSKPEDLLADDNLVKMFSPLDVRTLTYLGYLGINQPKYKILAQRLADEGKLVFVIAQKGDKKIILKTASEIMQDHDFIQNLNSSDASAVSYIGATETVTEEFKQKDTIKNLLNTGN